MIRRLLSALQGLSHDLRQQRMRTALTVLGITWGTVAVVVLLAFGVGLERQTIKRFHGLGDRIVILFGGTTTKPWKGFRDGRDIRLREEDVRLLESRIPEITQISPEYSDRKTPVRHGRQAANPNITGVYPVYGQLRNIIPAMGGRFIDQRDLSERRRVAVLGDALADLLFGKEEPVGQDVYVGQTPFTVVGVMRKKTQNSSYNSRDKDRIFIPASTHRALFGETTVANIVYRTSDSRLTKRVEDEVYRVLGEKYRFDPTDHDAVNLWDTAKWEIRFGYLFLGFNIFFAIVGSFTLTVGGIGVANIMYIVVRERTREIGLRRSMGATRRDILWQFLFEAGAVVAIGAAVGVLLSLGIVKGMAYIPIREFVGVPTISPTVVLATLGLLAAVALLAGYFPARRAAALDPAESLRH